MFCLCFVLCIRGAGHCALEPAVNKQKLTYDIITDQISKTGTRTPPREYNAWWSQETLSIYRLDDKKDICG